MATDRCSCSHWNWTSFCRHCQWSCIVPQMTSFISMQVRRGACLAGFVRSYISLFRGPHWVPIDWWILSLKLVICCICECKYPRFSNSWRPWKVGTRSNPAWTRNHNPGKNSMDDEMLGAFLTDDQPYSQKSLKSCRIHGFVSLYICVRFIALIHSCEVPLKKNIAQATNVLM